MERWVPKCSTDMTLLYRRESREFLWKIGEKNSLSQGNTQDSCSTQETEELNSSALWPWRNLMHVAHLGINRFPCRKTFLQHSFLFQEQLCC